MSFDDKAVLVLCGGLGTRLKSVEPDLPKVLVPINGIAFLDLLLCYINFQGIKNVYLALGYKSDLVLDYLRQNRKRYDSLGLKINAFVESEPLGTAGALRFGLCQMSVLPEQLIVMNGDTFIDADLRSLLVQNQQQESEMTMVAVEVEDRSRFGALRVENNLVEGFLEKGESRLPGLVNGGVYCMSLPLLKSLSTSNARSLEEDVFPELASRKGIETFIHHGAFLDYGTPDGLALARKQADKLARMMFTEKGIL